MPQREVSTTRNHGNPMSYTPGTVFPLPKVPTSRNPTTNPIPYLTMMPPSGQATSRYQVPSLMSYSPTIRAPLLDVPTSQNTTTNPYNPVPVMTLPKEPTPQNPMKNPMQHMQPDSSTNDHKLEKPPGTYLTLIVDALLASKHGMLVLQDICKSIMDKYKYYRIVDKFGKKTWKYGISSCLSANGCLYKAKESDAGRGHFWAIHPSCVEYFKEGNYTLLEANAIVKMWHNQNRLNNQTANEPSSSQTTNGTIPDSPPTVTVSTQKQNAPATSP